MQVSTYILQLLRIKPTTATKPSLIWTLPSRADNVSLKFRRATNTVSWIWLPEKRVFPKLRLSRGQVEYQGLIVRCQGRVP